MLTRREVEGELRSLGFRASSRQRREERERARKFARGAFGVLFGMILVALLSAAHVVRTARSGLAFGNTTARASEWVSSSGGGSAGRRYDSLFFTGRRTQQANIPKNRDRRRGDDVF
jgi:hypothetical protein